MKVRVGNTYKVKAEMNGYFVGDVFTVDAIEGYEVWITFDNGSPFCEDLYLMEVLDIEKIEVEAE